LGNDAGTEKGPEGAGAVFSGRHDRRKVTDWVYEEVRRAIIELRLKPGEPLSFRQLIVGANEKGIVIARFLAVLELYRYGAISFDQIEPLGELTLRWSTDSWTEDNLANLGADYDN